jgi:Zn-dependent protease with chaperone function
MDPIPGQCFDGTTSRAVPATLAGDGDELLLRLADGRERRCATRDAEASDRLARAPRRILFPGGVVFETPDDDAIDALLAAHGGRPAGAWIAWLEARWPVALGGLVVVALFSAGLVFYGLPWAAERVARAVPLSAERQLGEATLELLDDRGLLAPTGLTPARQATLQALFADMLEDHAVADGTVVGDAAADGTPDAGPSGRVRFLLRASPLLGPNAIALPGGTVVLTDQMVQLAEHDDELRAVLAHELGHVRGRHSLRGLLQDAGVSALAVAVLGDLSSVTALAGAVPVLLQAKHSRDFERDADAWARAWLARRGIDPARFDAILCRAAGPDGATRRPDAFSFLASHPPVEERARCP